MRIAGQGSESISEAAEASAGTLDLAWTWLHLVVMSIDKEDGKRNAITCCLASAPRRLPVEQIPDLT